MTGKRLFSTALRQKSITPVPKKPLRKRGNTRAATTPPHHKPPAEAGGMTRSITRGVVGQMGGWCWWLADAIGRIDELPAW
jgi:hypothetical protein